MILDEFRNENHLIWSFHAKVIKVWILFGLENPEKMRNMLSNKESVFLRMHY